MEKTNHPFHELFAQIRLVALVVVDSYPAVLGKYLVDNPHSSIQSILA